MQNIKIIHTNDLHSHFENFPKIERFIAEKRQVAKKANDDFLLLDIGDFMDRAHPLSEATDGIANVQWLNKMHYDFVTIGNNEGLGNSHQQLKNLFNDASFQVLLGNVKDKTTGKKFSATSKVLDYGENKIGLIGLTAPYILTYPLLDWDVSLVQDVLPGLVADLKKQGCGTVMLMSHLGISMDKKIAREYSDIDLIFGSHTHHLFENGEYSDGTYLAAAGKYGYYVGEVDLKIENNHLVDASISTFATAEMKELKSDETEIANYERVGHQKLQKQVLVELPKSLNNDFESKDSNIHYMLKAIEQVTDCDIAVLNNGLFLKELPKGNVTRDDIHDLLPHAMHVMKVTLKGRDLWRLFLEMEFNRLFLRRHQQKGMGFRGKYFGELVYDGVTVNIDKRKVLVHGEAIKPEKEYSVATLDHYLFVPYFPTIKIVGENKLYYPTFIRDVYSEFLKEKFGKQNE